jgi:imidazolonepropionase-like amidohydrolase
MVRYGMSPLQAIRSATAEAARALGKERELGTLRPGAWGDLIAARGDPLADVSTLERVAGVIKGGALVR